MQRIAASLATQMTAAGITPGNVASHKGYVPGDKPFLAYAMDENGEPVLGEYACALHQVGEDWVLWDDHGTRRIAIVFRNNGWQAMPPSSC